MREDREPRRRGFGRDFRLYFASQVVSQLGTSFTFFALPLLVFKLTGSPTNLALTTAATFVPYLLFGLVLGAVVDQVDRRRMMVSVDLARAAIIAALPVLSLTDQLEVEHIYVVAFLQSTLGILFDCGEFAAVPSLVPADDLVTANGWIMATNSAGQVLGPVLAGVLLAIVPVANLLFVDSASFLLSALALQAIRKSFNDGDPPAVNGGGEPVSRLRRVERDVREGLRYVLGHPVLRTISLMMAIINFVGATQVAQLVLFAKEELGATDTEVGVLYAAGSAGVVVVGLFAGAIRRRLSFAVTALGALVVSGLALAAFGLVRWFPVSLLLWAAASGFGLLLNINTGALRQAIVPPHLFGRVISIASVLAWSAIPLGAIAGAKVIEATDVGAVYVGMGLLTSGIAAAFAFSPVRDGDRYLAAATEARAATATATAEGTPRPT